MVDLEDDGGLGALGIVGGGEQGLNDFKLRLLQRRHLDAAVVPITCSRCPSFLTRLWAC